MCNWRHGDIQPTWKAPFCEYNRPNATQRYCRWTLGGFTANGAETGQNVFKWSTESNLLLWLEGPLGCTMTSLLQLLPQLHRRELNSSFTYSCWVTGHYFSFSVYSMKITAILNVFSSHCLTCSPDMGKHHQALQIRWQRWTAKNNFWLWSSEFFPTAATLHY